MKWVKMNKYLAESGDTRDAVHGKRKSGMWLDGVHCKIGPDGKVWINQKEVEKWVENGEMSYRQASR